MESFGFYVLLDIYELREWLLLLLFVSYFGWFLFPVFPDLLKEFVNFMGYLQTLELSFIEVLQCDPRNKLKVFYQRQNLVLFLFS
jgi:hypothetical protein